MSYRRFSSDYCAMFRTIAISDYSTCFENNCNLFSCSHCHHQCKPVFLQRTPSYRNFLLEDPTPFMLPAPSGDDNIWVNYDVDQAPALCVAEGPTPQGWYWESDLGFADPRRQRITSPLPVALFWIYPPNRTTATG